MERLSIIFGEMRDTLSSIVKNVLAHIFYNRERSIVSAAGAKSHAQSLSPQNMVVLGDKALCMLFVTMKLPHQAHLLTKYRKLYQEKKNRQQKKHQLHPEPIIRISS
jgi:hypothetical protein